MKHNYSTSNKNSKKNSPKGSHYSQHLNTFPQLRVFTDLHITENLSVATKDLKNVSGVYAIICTTTGAIYIGSSIFKIK